MAEEKVIIETEVKLGNSTNSVKSLKAELRQVTNELANLEEGSEAFIQAAKKAGALKDKIGDVKNTIGAFNPEAKFKALGDVVGIAANGFAAMQGAMALMGSESKELNKVIAQTQGAIALATGLNGLLGMGDAFKNLKSVGTDALKGIKGAIGATGIGLIVVAAGLLLANWEAISKAVKESFPIFNNIGSIFDKLREVAYGTGEVIKNAILMPFKTIGKAIQGDFAGAVEEIKKGYDVIGNYEKGAEKGREANRQAAAEERLKNLIKEKENELEVNKAAGKDTYKEELALNKLKQKAAKDNEEELKKIQQEEKVLIAGHKKDLADKAKAAAEKQKAEDKKREEETKSFRDAEAQYDAELLKKKLARQKEYDQQALDSRIEFARQTLENQEDQAKAEKEIADYTAKAKIESYQLGSQALMLAADLAGKNTAEGKILASAATLINTYLAAQSAYASQMAILTPDAPIRAAIAAGIAVASGLANVAAINSVQVPGGGGGASGGGGSMPSMPSAPAMRPTGFSTGQPSQTPPKVEPQKVFVVESDITNSQNKVARIQSKATIQ
jgi:hypothetical protein